MHRTIHLSTLTMIENVGAVIDILEMCMTCRNRYVISFCFKLPRILPIHPDNLEQRKYFRVIFVTFIPRQTLKVVMTPNLVFAKKPFSLICLFAGERSQWRNRKAPRCITFRTSSKKKNCHRRRRGSNAVLLFGDAGDSRDKNVSAKKVQQEHI